MTRSGARLTHDGPHFAGLRPEKYRVLNELGRGGMGVVYLAEDLLLRRTVALKVLYDHLAQDLNFVERFQKEARFISSLHHPNIVVVHGLDVTEGRFLIDMEYVDGLSLEKFVRCAAIPPPVAARIADNVLAGLLTCHEADIIHRDIKPANILLTKEGTAKIADFGLATACAEHLSGSMKISAASGLFLGTPRYAPPAAWEGSDPNPAWDLYSLAVMLYEMLTGEVAYPGETPLAIMRQQLKPLQPLSGKLPALSKEFGALVDTLLAGEGKMEATPSTQEVLLALRDTPEFQAASEGDTAATVRVALRKSHTESRRKNLAGGRLWAAAAGVLLILSAGMAWYISGHEAVAAPPSGVQSGLSRLGDSLVFLRPLPVDGSGLEDALWMLTSHGDGAQLELLALHKAGLWSMELLRQGAASRYTITGNWGEYLTPAQASLRYGSVLGEGLLDTTANRLSLSLRLINDRDNSEENLHLLARPFDAPLDQAKFVQGLEMNTMVQSLLYNELLPRNLAWAQKVDALMPSFSPGRVDVPRRVGDLRVDGLLTEPAWHPLPQTAAEDTTQSGQIQLRAFWLAEALMLGFSGDNVPPEFTLEIALAPGPWLPTGASPQYAVHLNHEGLIQGQARLGSTVLSWSCDWKGATVIQNGHWEAEIRIPLGGASSLALPQLDQPWRLNARLRDTAGKTLSTWGYSDVEAVEHGLMLNFIEDPE